MKKTTLAILTAALAVMTLSGCGESSSASTANLETNSSFAADAGNNAKEGSSESSSAEEEKKEDEVMDWDGLKLYYPSQKGSEFAIKSKAGFITWIGHYTGTEKVYYGASSDQWAIQRMEQLPDYTEVADYFDSELADWVATEFDTYREDTTNPDLAFHREVETEEKIQLEDYFFVKYTGVLHGVNKEKEQVELPYCAVCGVTNFPASPAESEPVILIAFTPGKDEASIQDTRTLIDKAIENYGRYTFDFQ